VSMPWVIPGAVPRGPETVNVARPVPAPALQIFSRPGVASTFEKEEIVNGHHLRGAARGHQQRMRRVRDVDGARQPFGRRPFAAVPEIVQNADGNPPVDDARARVGGDGRRRTILPGAREQQHLVVTVCSGVRANQLVDVLANAGSLPQRGPVVDEDAHNGRVQSQPTETQSG